MKTDNELRCDIKNELQWEPSIDETQIGVAVSNGVVTLSGSVASFGEKDAVNKAVLRVQGVKAVADEIDVRSGGNGIQNRSTHGVLRIQMNTENCELSPASIAAMERCLHTLKHSVQCFPTPVLHINVVHHPSCNDYHVRTSLVLSGRTLFTGERHAMLHPAFEQCVHKLQRKVKAFKQRMHADFEWQKQAQGSHVTLEPTQELDVARLDQAVSLDDYAAFRRALDVFEAALTQRVGRWIQRYPEIESQLGDSLAVSDIVEDVFLTAFEQFSKRSHDVPPGAWLESLIDPTVRSLIQSTDEELTNIAYAKTVL